MMPGEDEKNRIMEAQMANPDVPLGNAEQFLLTLASISELEARLRLWAFRLDYDVLERVSLRCFYSCAILRHRGIWQRVPLLSPAKGNFSCHKTMCAALSMGDVAQEGKEQRHAICYFMS